MPETLKSGELFEDLRAWWPARPGSNLKDAAPSDRHCECEIFWWKYGRRKAPKARCVSRQAFWYQVNHLRLSLCRFHATQLARRKGVEVRPAAVDLAAFSQH